MGKRSDFERIPRDFYPTPEEAVLPLLPHLDYYTIYTEPCVGQNHLVEILAKYGHECVYSYDYEEDATKSQKFQGECFITNPPWDRKILHPIIQNLAMIAPTWLLFDADWVHTKQSRNYTGILSKIVSVGRVKWIPDSNMTGKDNCCWYLFDKNYLGITRFYGRT